MTDKSPRRKSAVVLGAQHTTGLMTARALRYCDVDIIGIHFSDSPCLYSRLWSSLVRAEKNAGDILAKLEILALDQNMELLLFPADDESVKILSDYRDRLPSNCTMMLPDSDTVDLLLDKSRFYSWAEKHDFAVPPTARVFGFEELDYEISQLGYPVLLKPLYRKELWDDEFPNNKVFILENAEQRHGLPEKLFEVASPMLLQKWIPGGDDRIYFCLVQYSNEGKLVNYFSGRKLMQWPPLGGSTAIAVSDELDETRSLSVTIFDTLNYKGLGSLEFKKDPHNGKFYIMEPTVGRNDLQSYLAVTGGVNLTKQTCREMLGEPPESIRYRRRSAWFLEPSVYYGLRYYLKTGNFYLIKHVAKLLRMPGFGYLSRIDAAPFIVWLKSKFGLNDKISC